MAALQTLRNKPALLMSVIGGALLLFIVTMVMENQTGLMGADMEAGEVYGEEISIQDFESKVTQEQNYQEVARTLGNYFQTGQLAPQQLTEREREEIRQQVWNDILAVATVKDEAKKFGLMVTDDDIKNALMGTQYQETQFMMMVGSFTSGNPTIDGYKQFVNNFEKNLSQIRMQQPELEDLFLSIYQACMYSEKKLQNSILLGKYSSLMRNSITANAVTAQMDLNEANTTVEAEIVAVPYSTIADSTLQPDPEALKNKYNAYKEMFYSPSETRTVKLIDVNVTASANDRAQLFSEVREQETALRNAKDAEEVAAVVSNSKSNIPYNNVYFLKSAYTQNVISGLSLALDTMKVGDVKATSNDGQFISTYKLVGKVNTADSLLVRGVAARDKAHADSILTAVKAGGKLGDIAKSLGQQDTTLWIHNPIYIERPAGADSSVYTNICQLGLNETAIVAEQQNYAVMEVLEKKHNSNKYNVAIIKCPIEYSDETYNQALSKLNNFLANNKTVEAFAENAAKEGYYIQDIPNFNSESYMRIRQIGGEQASAAVRWILDEAEDGDISNVFECSNSERGTHLLAAAVASSCDKEYLPLENEGVNEFITALVKQDKKAEIIKNQLKNVKSVADAKAANGAITDSLKSFSVAQFPQIALLGTPEPAVAGVLAKSKKGEFVNGIQGGAAVYYLQVNDKSNQNNGISLETVIMNTKNNQMGNIFGMNQSMYGQRGFNEQPLRLLNAIMQREGNIVDKRYKF